MSTQELYAFRIPNTDEGRAILKGMRQALNRESYSLKVLYSGPRPYGTDQKRTLRENATTLRVYIKSHIEV